jgi:PAS domain S-box-containing protein
MSWQIIPNRIFYFLIVIVLHCFLSTSRLHAEDTEASISIKRPDLEISWLTEYPVIHFTRILDREPVEWHVPYEKLNGINSDYLQLLEKYLRMPFKVNTVETLVETFRQYRNRVPLWAENPRNLSLVLIVSLSLLLLLLALLFWNKRLKHRIVFQTDHMRQGEENLRKLIVASSEEDEESYFRSMVLALCETNKATCTYIGKLQNGDSIQTLAVAKGSRLIDNFSYSLVHTPCKQVTALKTCIYPSGVAKIFPKDETLTDMEIEAYIGSPVFDHNKTCIGIVVSLYDHPLEDTSYIESIFQLFALHIGSEMARLEGLRVLRSSERHYRLLIENLPSVVWATTADGQTLYISPNIKKVYGYTFQEIIAGGESLWLGRIHPDDLGKVQHAFGNLFHDGTPFDVEYRIQRKDGEWIWLHDHATITEDVNGIQTAYGVFSDITEKIEQAVETQENRKRYQQLVEGSADLITIVDPKGHFIFVNHMANRIFGISPESCVGLSFSEFLHPEDKVTTSTWFTRQLESHALQGTIENRQLSRTGEVHTMLWNCTFNYDNIGNLVNINSIARDISIRKRTEQALEKRIVALTQPLSETGKINFEDLFNLEEVQRLQDQFAKATGVASIITQPDGTPITRQSNFCRLCKDYLCQAGKEGVRCETSSTDTPAESSSEPAVHPCKKCGLLDAKAAINVGGKHVANWFIGQVRESGQSDEPIRLFARERGRDEEAFTIAFEEVPVMEAVQFKNVAQALTTLAEQLSTTAYQNVQQARFIASRNQAALELRRNEENLQATLNSIRDAVIATDTHGTIKKMNPVAEQLTGWSFSEAINRILGDVFCITQEDSDDNIVNTLQQILDSDESETRSSSQAILLARDGRKYLIAHSGAPIRSETGELSGVVVVFRDISEEQALQEQLRQSQKMEAIGLLAGGVAHDFNNMLSGIIGATELLDSRLHEDQVSKKFLNMISDAARRAAGLTSKLLAFARKQPALRVNISIHQVLLETVELLNNTIDRRIEVAVNLAATEFHVLGDGSALQSAFLNIGINSAHAMPDGGTLSIATGNIMLDEADCASSPFNLIPGHYLQVDMHDTGRGICPDDLPRIFEPFFTTKALGKGTGLGLAASYGTIQQHQGSIHVVSNENSGTRFSILLPLMTEEPLEESGSPSQMISGSGRILLVDDEDIVRATVQAMLQDLGYHILLAENGQAGLEMYMQHHQSIDLVILDMIMPVMNGRDCFAALQKVNPEVRVILSSGYLDKEDLAQMETLGLRGFISKPFGITEISKVIHEVLHSTS